MKIKCEKCSRDFEMPNSFYGRIVCENCDPFMKNTLTETRIDMKRWHMGEYKPELDIHWEEPT